MVHLHRHCRGIAGALTISLLAWLVSSETPLHAHNSDVSSTVVRVDGETLKVEVVMSAETAMALLGVPVGSQGTPADTEDLLRPLRTNAARDVYRFVLDGAPLELRDVVVEMREEDGVVFFLGFKLPGDAPGAAVLECEARYLVHLTPVHRAALALVDERGGVIVGKILTPEKRTEIIRLPDPAAR